MQFLIQIDPLFSNYNSADFDIIKYKRSILIEKMKMVNYNKKLKKLTEKLIKLNNFELFRLK